MAHGRVPAAAPRPHQRFVSEIHLFKKFDLEVRGRGQPWIDLARI